MVDVTIATDFYTLHGLSVHVLVMTASPAKMAEPFEMPFVGQSHMGHGTMLWMGYNGLTNVCAVQQCGLLQGDCRVTSGHGRS